MAAHTAEGLPTTPSLPPAPTPAPHAPHPRTRSCEGVLGGAITLCLLLPAVQWLPGREGGGVHEDSVDTLAMLAHSGPIRAAVLLYVLLMAGYNIAGG